MRIQHNIMAMNAYRNYNTNTSALSKNLEKLSSGYKINRAGDDAAGLAISEKMRAQISGLNAAQKNVKDGISLVKTAEGAMQEIQDMLNRMKYLATQSANGTYDDDVDRFNLQKEVDALRDEIDRIADSANFNGINLLDGKMGFGGTTATDTTDTTDTTDPTTPKTFEAAVAAGDLTTLGLDKCTIGGLSDKIKSVEVKTGPAETTGDGKAAASIDGTGKLTLTITGKGTGGNEADDAAVKTAIETAIDNAVTAKTLTTDEGAALKKSLTVDYAAAAGGIQANKTATAVTPAETKEAAKAARAAGARAGGQNSVFTVDTTNVGTGKAVTEADYQGQLEGEIKVKVETTDGTTTVTATIGDKTVEATVESWDDTGENTVTFQGEGAGLTVKIDGSKLTGDALAEVTIGTAKAAEADPTNPTDPTAPTDPAGDKTDTEKIASGTKIEVDLSAIKTAGTNFKDGDTIKIGDQTYKFGTAAAGDTEGTEPQTRAARATDIPVTLGKDFDESMKNLVAEVEKNKDTTGISASYKDGKLTLTTTKDFNSAEDLKKAANVTVTGDKALKDAVEKAWNEAVDEAAGGNKSGNGSIILQIGDTNDPFNQLTVTIGDMHTTAMGTEGGKSIAEINIRTLTGAQDAISVIKDAINYVSSVRGDLGAVQNRLEHTANNLSVMAENIQDAESTIRDTDVAEEMMAYTKNNILIQSAQAMLAQANAVPQGVLQLLG